jgi:cobalt-zinc-cadmium efflux system membrane fusion protein
VFQARGDWCAEHGFPESFCPTCHPDAVFPEVEEPTRTVEANEDIDFEGRTVRFRTPELEAAAGIDTTLVRRASSASAIPCAAHVDFDRDHTADVRALVPGVVRRVLVSLGAAVTAGTPLVELESVRVGESQAALLAARERVRVAAADLERQRQLVALRISAGRELELAEQELGAAQAELDGVSTMLRLTGARGHAGRFTLRAPIDGVVVQRAALPGLLANEDTSLALISDISRVWVMCEVAERDAGDLALGQTMFVRAHEQDAALQGALTWIASSVDPRTRTVTARAEVPNEDGRLRANQFAQGVIETGPARSAFTVARASIQRLGARELVFVRTDVGVYEPRGVRRTTQTLADEGQRRRSRERPSRRPNGEDRVMVEGDLQDGDAIVTTGAFLLRTELMPGAIGAGCCEVSPGGGG